MNTAHGAPPATQRATLYVVATPIGNLRDFSARAKEILGVVAVVAAEDTRVTRRLLDANGITTRLMAVHEHNEARAAGDIMEVLASGQCVAIVSDAGTPAVSDPGARVVAAVREAGYAVSPIPGASAAIAALSVSGFAAPHFLFVGFLPARAAARRAELKRLRQCAATLVFYEAPHRVAECLEDMAYVLGAPRRVLIARELTKLFEETHICMLGDGAAWLAGGSHRTKGEFVLVVEGAAYAPAPAADADKTLTVLLEELPLKQAVALSARISGVGRNELYTRALQMRKTSEEGET